jgi:hypothetical protein
MAGDKIYYSLYQKPTVEMRRRHFWEIIEEANHNFTIAQQLGETITIKRRGQVKLKVLVE